MNENGRTAHECRFLALAATREETGLLCAILERAGIACECPASLSQLCVELDAGAAGLLLGDGMLPHIRGSCLSEWLSRQPRWSDVPVLLFSRADADAAFMAEAVALLGNVTLLEQPVREVSLANAALSALHSRRRQYRTRDDLMERERGPGVEALLAAIVASSDDAIISKTLDGKILSWNDGAQRLFGYSADEVVGKPILLLIPPERHNEEAEILRRLRAGERIEHFETVRVAKGGRRLDISLTVSPVRDQAGRVVAASKVARDIGQRKRAEAALLEADRRKDEFLAVLAHELRNPLAPIRNSLHILRLTGRVDPAAESVVEMMDRQVNHMVRLVDDLLEVSRITRGAIELRKEVVDLADIVRGAVETSRPFIESGGHDLDVALPSEALSVEGDPVRLTQVFANLLNNAAKYTDAGGRIRVAVTSDGGGVAVSVRDDGVGIPPEALPRIFDLFMQADPHAERRQGGVGIGLTLAKRLVEMHGGQISAFSAGKGQGSEFVVRLPRAATQLAAGTPRAVHGPHAALTSRRVLVVDDNVDSAESMGLLLRLLGVDTQVVHNGPDALEALPSYKPNVVLLDIGMPGMDGKEVARRIRRHPDGENVTLIALTGWGQEEDRRRTKEAGFDFHLIKPADVNALQALLASLELPPGVHGAR